MASPFIYGKTRNCCKCGAIATNWYGWLRKSRDGIKAGFCEQHRPTITAKNPHTFGSHNLFGIYNKGMEELVGSASKRITPKSVISKYGLDKNIIEQ